MKNIKIKLTVILGLFILSTSCSNDYLKEDPQDKLFADNLFVNKDGLQQGLNGIYSLAREERKQRIQESNEVSAIWKVGTDVAWNNYSYASLRAFDVCGSNLTPANATLDSVFNWLYDVVNACNTIISRAESPAIDWQGKTPQENEVSKNLIIAQARLFRAWAYRHLTNSWGNVPLTLKEVDGNTFKTYWPLTPVAEVRAQMEQDLIFAEQYLPVNYSNPNLLSKAVAQHYLAELYLTMGGQENYVKAEIAAEAVLANPNFALITQRFGVDKSKPGVPFMDQFNPLNAIASTGNTETLWTFANAPDLIGSEDLAMRRTYVNRYDGLFKKEDLKYVYLNYGGRGLGRVNHTIYVEKLYEASDDRYSAYAISKSYKNENGSIIKTTSVPTFAAWKINNNLWPATKKWDYIKDLNNFDGNNQYSSMPYLRLAETYLLAAEAEFRLGKLNEAADHLNALRNRSHATPILAGAVTADAILDERARELMTEEHRRYVLNRFGVLVSRTKLYNKFSQITDRDILFPLPQNFIDSNDGPTAQNPGWEQ